MMQPGMMQQGGMQAYGQAPGQEGGKGKGPKPEAGVDGNWACPACGSVNFANRGKCFRCQAPKPGGAGVGPTGSGEDAIDSAAGSALLNVAHMEQEWDFDKLRWKVASYF